MEVRKALGQKRFAPELGAELPEVSENFFTHMNNSLSLAKNNVLLVFDEIENISPDTAASSHWRNEGDTLFFWQIIRSFIQSDAKGRLAVCIVGTSPRLLEIPKLNAIANPVYLFANKQFIPSLTFDDTLEMVERLGYFMGLEFPPEIVAELQKDFGGHPFFIRQVCSKIHQLASPNRPQKVSRASLNQAMREFSGQLENYLREIVENLRLDYPEEFELLKTVIEGNNKELSEFGRDAPELIDHLIGYGLIERLGDDLDIRFDAIKRALQYLVKRQENVEDRWKEISTRRNALEINIRVALFHWSNGVSREKWNIILGECLTKTRMENLRFTEPRLLFSKNDSHLYLTDLMMLLKRSIRNAILRGSAYTGTCKA